MKLRAICKSKIHRAVVTGADLHYAGSIGIDAAPDAPDRHHRRRASLGLEREQRAARLKLTPSR